tara:strand:- start:4926 stop:5270 length:345 start_codon:yes stop_codon:yes gene_type:complete
MSDIRFIMIGVVVITIGFIVLGVYGEQFTDITVQTNEFSDCYEYHEEQPAVQIDCDKQIQQKNVLFGIVIGILAGGGLALVKGIKGRWDQDVKPEEMVGPGGNKKNDDDVKEES